MAQSLRPCSWVGLVVVALLYHCDAQMTCTQTSCRNGGTCVVTQGSLTCLCPPSSTGSTCEVLTVCVADVAAAITWDAVPLGTVLRIPCGNADPQLMGSMSMVKRTCSQEGVWGELDFSQCTLPQRTNPFLLVWLVVQSDSVMPLEAMRTQLEQELSSMLGTSDAESRLVRIQSIMPAAVSLTFKLSFNTSEFTLARRAEIRSSLLALREVSSLADYSLVPDRTGYQGFMVSESCPCSSTRDVFADICINLTPSGPCRCTGPSGCTCTPYYVGDGVRCTPDRDGDGYPDVALGTCSSTSTAQYCTNDTCSNVYNPNQEAVACETRSDFNGCRTETGLFGITWASTNVSKTDTQLCPSGDGFATRMCSPMGWLEPNAHECETFDFRNARTQAESAFAASGRDLQTRLRDSELVTSDIRGFTGPRIGTSLLPADLNTTNLILSGIVDLLEESLSTTENVTDQTVFTDIFIDCLDIFSNVLDTNNLNGWTELQEVDAGSQKLLDNAERYGLYIANQLEDSENRILWAMDNIVFGARRSDPENGQSITFPESLDDLSNTSFTSIPAKITIPHQFLMERRGGGARTATRTVPVTTILFRNMEAALPTDGNGTSMRVASMVLSTQVMTRQGVPGQSSALSDNPVTLSFNFDADENASVYRCAYWKFSDPIGSGGWEFDGVEMVSSDTEDGVTTINCKSTHLTSFAVLVDVSGTLNPGDNTTGVSQGELVALQIVSYIGCAISIICLLASIIFFLTLGKKLFTSVHYFIHLNLAISLCLGYLVFVAGVEPARANRGACIFIAAVLHYLFLAVFCWMLCEGIMLYLMLVVVFSRISKKWWFFLILGYGLPIIPVVITLGARTSEYGVEAIDSDGNSSLVYCWLSTENGVIWAFVAPMLAIIAVNVFFLCVALATVFRTTRSKAQRSRGNSKYKEYKELFKTLMVATAVLLPILGLTWVLGLFAVNRNTTVFAWLFTIFNSLQGVFFFIFHVLRSEKVWQSSRAKFLRSKASSTFRSTTRSSLSGSTIKKPTTPYTVSMSMRTEELKVVPTAFSSTEDTELGTGQAWDSTVDKQEPNKEDEVNATMVIEETHEKPDTDSRDVVQIDTCSKEPSDYECSQSANLVESD